MSRLYKLEFSIEDHLGLYDAETLYSRFDAPYLDHESVISVCDEIDREPGSIPVILTHHNLFPQRVPRIAIFPEMLNAGYVRDRLKKLERPIIYLHGHVHDSLVESLLSDVEDYQLSIIAISAPLFKDGFNHIQLFTSGDGVPLGVQINEYRHDKVAFGLLKPRRIRFYGKDKGSLLLDESARTLVEDMRERKNVAWKTLATTYSEERLLELEFMGELAVNRPVQFNKATWRVNRA